MSAVLGLSGQVKGGLTMSAVEGKRDLAPRDPRSGSDPNRTSGAGLLLT